jgi:cellulose synthase/poly-beta-1,6-N-acetylglucosamine synthase-like glycosyltransferase
MASQAVHVTIKTILDNIFRLHEKSGDFVYNFYQSYSRAMLDFLHVIFDNIFTVLLVMTIAVTFFYLIMAITVFLRKKKVGKLLPEGNEPLVTVQIPTYNELAALSCAKHCLEFDYPKEKMQIIIGDDSSDKKISAKIDAFAKKHPGIIQVTRRGRNVGFKPGNLNHMLTYTKGEYVVIFDSDFLPPTDFLRRILAPFSEDKDISVVQARWNIKNFSQNIYSVLGGTISLVCHQIMLPFISRDKGMCFLCGSAEAIRKKDLLEAGGWQSGSLTEDIECSLRLIMKNKKLVYLEDCECDCEAPFTFKDLCKQQMRWAYGVITAIKVHFWALMKSRTRASRKLSVFIFASGYLFALLLLGVTIFGILAVISTKPAPIDWPRFLGETSRNILLTSGFLISSVLALWLGKRIKELPRMVGSSLSVGLAVTYHVNVGIAKALFGRKMHWFMLNKNGNKNVR